MATYDDLHKEVLTSAQKLAAKAERDVIAAYKDALTRIRAELAEMYAKFAVGDELTYSQMLNYGRLKAIFENVAQIVNEATGEVTALIEEASGSIYIDAYKRTAYMIEAGGGQQATVAINWGIIQPEAVKAAVQLKIDKLTLSDRLAKHRTEIIKNIRENVTRGLIQGESYPKMAARVKDVLDGDATKAMRVIRTEAHRVTQQGQQDVCEEAIRRGANVEKEWSALLDDRTRDEHGALDGVRVPVDQPFTIDGYSAMVPGGFGEPEMDINCRCHARPHVIGFESSVRYVKGEGLQPWQNYATWDAKRKLGAAVQ
jgi:SPP1 gp7 family putative phage head morphogenesis protein